MACGRRGLTERAIARRLAAGRIEELVFGWLFARRTSLDHFVREFVAINELLVPRRLCVLEETTVAYQCPLGTSRRCKMALRALHTL